MDSADDGGEGLVAGPGATRDMGQGYSAEALRVLEDHGRDLVALHLARR